MIPVKIVLGRIKPSKRLVKSSPEKWWGPEEPEQKDRAVDKKREPQGRRHLVAVIGPVAGIAALVPIRRDWKFPVGLPKKSS
jgi:hypothetical protein